MERAIYLYKNFWGCKGAKIAVARVVEYGKNLNITVKITEIK